MNIALRRELTVPEYLAWAETQSEWKRTELINGQIVAMSPEFIVHTRLKSRAFTALTDALEASQLAGEVLIDGVTVPIDTHTAYEPDVLLYLGSLLSGREMTAPEPVVVVEVLSPTTRHTDTSAKLIGYFKLPSLQHYLIIDPETMTLTHHVRDAGGSTSSTTHASGRLRLDPPGLTLDLDAIFGTP